LTEEEEEEKEKEEEEEKKKKKKKKKKSQQILGNFNENRRYQNLAEDALDRTIWETCFGKDCGPVVKQTAE
jgi:hypothetical protein